MYTVADHGIRGEPGQIDSGKFLYDPARHAVLLCHVWRDDQPDLARTRRTRLLVQEATHSRERHDRPLSTRLGRKIVNLFVKMSINTNALPHYSHKLCINTA